MSPRPPLVMLLPLLRQLLLPSVKLLRVPPPVAKVLVVAEVAVLVADVVVVVEAVMATTLAHTHSSSVPRRQLLVERLALLVLALSPQLHPRPPLHQHRLLRPRGLRACSSR